MRDPFETADDNAVYRELIRAGRYTYDVVGELQTLDGERTHDLTGMITDGQVDIRARTHMGRSCALTIYDPNKTLLLADNGTYLARQLALWVRINVYELGKIALVPIMCGPFTHAQRIGPNIEAAANGKAALLTRALRAVRTIPANTRVVDILYEVLHFWAAERVAHIKLPHLPDRHPTAITTKLITTPLAVIRNVVDPTGYKFGYDGAGDTLMRQFPTSSVLQLSGGQNGSVLGPITRDESVEGFCNVVDVHGALAKAGDDQAAINSTRAADPTSPLSAQRLRRTAYDDDDNEIVSLGWHPKTFVNRAIKLQARADEVAESLLAEGLNLALSYELEARPVWGWDEWDCVETTYAGDAAKINPPRVSLPLTPSFGNYMTIGYNGHLSYSGPRARIS